MEDGKLIQKRNTEVYSFPIKEEFSGAFIFHQRKSGFSLLLPMEHLIKQTFSYKRTIRGLFGKRRRTNTPL